jgi:hypothetical protein
MERSSRLYDNDLVSRSSAQGCEVLELPTHLWGTFVIDPTSIVYESSVHVEFRVDNTCLMLFASTKVFHWIRVRFMCPSQSPEAAEHE